MIKRIKWFFIQLLALDYRYSDIPDFEKKYEKALAEIKKERKGK